MRRIPHGFRTMMEHESVAALRKCVFAVSVFGDDPEVIANLTHDLTATDWVAAIHLLWRMGHPGRPRRLHARGGPRVDHRGNQRRSKRLRRVTDMRNYRPLFSGHWILCDEGAMRLDTVTLVIIGSDYVGDECIVVESPTARLYIREVWDQPEADEYVRPWLAVHKDDTLPDEFYDDRDNESRVRAMILRRVVRRVAAASHMVATSDTDHAQ